MATGSLVVTIDRPAFVLAYESTVSTLAVTVSSPTFVGVMNDWSLSITLSSPTLVASSLGGNIASLAQNVSIANIIDQFTDTRRVRLNAQIISGRMLYTNLALVRPTFTLSSTQELTYTLVQTLRRPTLNTASYSSSFYSFTRVLPRITIDAYLNNFVIATDPNRQTWAMNTITAAHSRYTNYNFNSFFRIGSTYYGANSTGIYKLLGDKDDVGINQTNINAEVKLPISQFDSIGLKACDNAIIYGRCTGDMEVTVLLDEQQERTNLIVSYNDRNGMHRKRVKIPKGLKGNTWGFGLKNVDGANFDINLFEVYLRELQRLI